MAEPSADAPPAMSDAQAETLRGVVSNLRRCLPDPSARDVHDAIVEHDGEMAAWATAGRVKKLCTKMNKELRRSGDRRGDEPDETDGPVLDLTALRRWPSTTSPIFLHVAARGDSRVFFPHEHHRAVEGEDTSKVSVGVAFRRSIAEAARLHDENVFMWRLVTRAEDDKTDRTLDDPAELVMVCKAARVFEGKTRRAKDSVETNEKTNEKIPSTLDARCVFEVAFTFGDARKNAHKRLLEKPLAENAGAIGEIRLEHRGARDVWLNHLRRNRHYEDKYSGKFKGTEWWDEFISTTPPTRTRPDGDGARPKTQTWESSYVVTPRVEWFR